MIIYPAIDLRDGKCVRLYQGDYQRETIYHNDPFSMIKTFESEGAQWLHMIDLDGAKDPQKNQFDLISELIKKSSASVQTGGGIRFEEQVQTLLDAGAARVIIGSLAVRKPEEVSHWFRVFGTEQLVLAVDVMVHENQEPHIAIDAWQTKSDHTLFGLLEYYMHAGLKHIVCTDITRDGTLMGPNIDLYKMLGDRFPALQVQASGGIQSLEDLQLLRANHLAGAISGRALYENKFTLREALTC